MKVQRKATGTWRTVAKGRTETGSRVHLDLVDRGGRHRAVVPRKDDCRKGISAVVAHRHQ